MSAHRDAVIDQFTRRAAPFSAAPAITDRAAPRIVAELTGAGRIFADAIASDALGVDVCRPGAEIHFAYPVAILVCTA